MNKNQIIVSKCVDYTYDGLGVIKDDAFCVFVKDIIKDEEGKIIITKVNKNYAYGKLLELDKPSKDRVIPKCACSKRCGGCQLQHMSYQAQLDFKRNHVEHEIRQISKLNTYVNETLGMDIPFYYRNKVQLPTIVENNSVKMGFYKVNSHDIIEFDNCVLQSDRANKIVLKIKELLLKYPLRIRHLMLREMIKTNQIMLVLVCWDKNVETKLIEEIKNIDEAIVSIMLNVNKEETNVILSKENYCLYGKDYLIDELCGLKFKIGVNSFYQVNNVQTEVLYNTAISMAKLNNNDVVLDLYCGVGTIGLAASKYCKKVIGIEIVEQAIINAKENAKINGITNCEFICSDVSKVIDKINEKIDCIFVDPPRKGCDQKTLDYLVKFKPSRIVYVSCNPSTLARDLFFLKDYYSIEIIQPVDMFPQTHHVETIVLLSDKKVSGYVGIDLDVDKLERKKQG